LNGQGGIRDGGGLTGNYQNCLLVWCFEVLFTGEELQQGNENRVNHVSDTNWYRRDSMIVEKAEKKDMKSTMRWRG
jgi:hypothetical protein